MGRAGMNARGYVDKVGILGLRVRAPRTTAGARSMTRRRGNNTIMGGGEKEKNKEEENHNDDERASFYLCACVVASVHQSDMQRTTEVNERKRD